MTDLYDSYIMPTEVDLSQGLVGLFQYLNVVTNGWFANLILITIFIIFSSGFYFAKRDIFGGFSIGGFATLLIGTLFWASGVINTPTMIIVIAVAILSFASLWINKHDM